MDWQKEAVDKLEKYRVILNSLTSLRHEIDRLNYDMNTVAEDMRASYELQKQELMRRYHYAQVTVSSVDNALKALEQRERYILTRMYISENRCSANKLSEELFVCYRTMRRWKSCALQNFTIALYGTAQK